MEYLMPKIADLNEATLWKNFKENNCMKSRDTLILQYRPLAHKIASNLHKTLLKPLIFEDICSHAYIGLIDAIDKYNLSYDNKFITYAYVRIYGAIIDETRKQDFIPRSRRTKIKKFKQMRDCLVTLGVEPTHTIDKKLAKEVGLTDTELNYANNKYDFNYITMSSLSDVDINDTEFTVIHEQLQSKDIPTEFVMNNELKTLIGESLTILSKRHRAIIELIFFQNLTHKEVSAKLNIPQQTINQIKNRSLEKLKKYINLNHKEIASEYLQATF